MKYSADDLNGKKYSDLQKIAKNLGLKCHRIKVSLKIIIFSNRPITKPSYRPRHGFKTLCSLNLI